MKNQKPPMACLHQKSNNLWKWMAILPAVVAFILLLHAAPVRAQSVYVTSSGNGPYLFGSLDLATGQFSQISTTNEFFFGLTTGPGNTIFGADAISNHLFTISPTGVTTQFGTSVAPNVFNGLAYSGAGNNFFADNNLGAGMNLELYSIAGNGNSNSFIGTMTTPPKAVPTGGLAFGPSGNLYFDYTTDTVNFTNSTLYTVNTSTGALTPIGSGLGSPLLTLVSVGSTFYGIDTADSSNIGIYTINTTTGVATSAGVTVTGLPSGYGINTATHVPDTGSTLGLLFLSLTALLGASRLGCFRLA
jgi:hypothetical protein